MTALSALRAGTAALALTFAAAATAQFVQQPTPTADALAAQMRQLGTNPRDVYALIAAGELSTKLGDPTAALGFFGRAQAIEPSNPRIPAGRAGALVLLERPGEALMLYAQAERAGAVMTPYLAQRGLAYDLTGQPGHAQRDYRRALTIAPDDETIRRLALSLGNSGRKDEAMAVLDPLLRRSDRAAWRARACIMAVSGDVPGAQRIAASMMNGGAALSPFFARLPSLSLADRAFAVHFGSLASTPARVADARLAPPVAPLPVAPQAAPTAPPVAVAAATNAQPSNRRATRQRSGRQPIPIVQAGRSAAIPARRVETPPVQAGTRPPSPAVTLASTTPPRQTFTPTPTPTPTATPVATPTPAPIPTTAPAPTPVPSPTPTPTPAPAPPPVVVPTPKPTSTPPAVEVVSPPPRSAVEPVASPQPPPIAAPTPSAAATPTPDVRTPEVAQRNTTMLASIIETIAIPASELDVVAPPAPPASPRPKPVVVEPKKPEPKKPEATKPEVKKPDATKPNAKKPEAKKPEAKKPEPKKPDPAKAEPARWWVQVAGGANAADLGKDWKRLATKSPAAFKGRTPWTTPLRATNRLLAGPFKTQAEAGAFVNLLAKDGSSAFAWRSEAGQVIERLPSK